MLYSVIYTVDSDKDTDITEVFPPPWQHELKLWSQTEGDEEADREGWHHAKWVALLTQTQFDAFIEHCYLYVEDVETMGSIGAPGFGFGWAPAISFRGEFGWVDEVGRYCGNVDAYVSPIPGHLEGDEIVPNEGVELPLGDEEWQRIRKEIIEEYS